MTFYGRVRLCPLQGREQRAQLLSALKVQSQKLRTFDIWLWLLQNSWKKKKIAVPSF
jgi:hypothetical protein